MELTHSCDMFAVFDDFLTAESFQRMGDYLRTEDFQYVRARQRQRAFKLLDGDPLIGPSVLSNHPSPPAGVRVCPSGLPTDLVVEALIAAMPELSPWVGSQGQAWEFFTCSPYIYPMGSGLSWHKDAHGRTGSYVLYLHPRWQADWGAELLLSDTRPQDEGDDLALRRYVAEHGTGRYVAPKPNRLVVMRSGVMHAVKKVDVSAGDNARFSVAGFFQSLPPAGAVAGDGGE